MSDSPNTNRAHRFALWFGFLGGALAWIAHLIAISVIAEWGCFTGLHHWTWLGLSAVAWLVIGVSVVMMVIAIAATWAAWRVGRRIHDATPADPRGTESFMARAGLLTSGLFVLIILVESVPILFFLRDC